MKKLLVFVFVCFVTSLMVKAQSDLYNVNYTPTEEQDKNGNPYTEVSLDIKFSAIEDSSIVIIKAGKVPGSMDLYFFEMQKDSNAYQIPGITRIKGTDDINLLMGNFRIVPDSFYVDVDWFKPEE